MYHDPRIGPPPHLLHPAHFPPHLRPPIGPPPDSNHNTTPNPNKPRIWSLADMASKDVTSKDEPSSATYSSGSSPGKILSPLAARGLHPLHHPYMRPDLYRNFYGSAAAAAHLSDPHNVALLESYQRQLGAMAANGALPFGKAGGPPFAPLSLTTSSSHHMQPRASSPASSTSSSPGDRNDPPPQPEKPTALTTSSSKP